MQVKKETKLAEAIDRVFLAALLITGNTDAAETAVLHGIATLDGTLSSEGLLLATLKSAIDEGRNPSGPNRGHSRWLAARASTGSSAEYKNSAMFCAAGPSWDVVQDVL